MKWKDETVTEYEVFDVSGELESKDAMRVNSVGDIGGCDEEDLEDPP